MRVCQFRHDGNTGLQCSGGRKAAESASQEDQHFYFTALSPPVKHWPWTICISQAIENSAYSAEFLSALCVLRPRMRPSIKAHAQNPEAAYPSFAVIEIFAFNTFDTGQPFSAASAYF